MKKCNSGLLGFALIIAKLPVLYSCKCIAYQSAYLSDYLQIFIFPAKKKAIDFNSPVEEVLYHYRNNVMLPSLCIGAPLLSVPSII